MKTILFIQAETNLHVGSENTTVAGLIDKTVQRDALTSIPCINASSLKGAMNEYATNELNLSSEERIAIFGVDKNDKARETAKGRCIFFDASLLLLPVQDDKNFYKLVTCEKQIMDFLSLAAKMGIEYEYNEFLSVLQKNDTRFNKTLVSFEVFKELCDDYELPIIARNSLSGNGNLWYEQVMPRKAVFGALLVAEDKVEVLVKNDKQEEVKAVDVNAALKKFDNKIVQIGANATVGYGFCTFKIINKK